jgi:hypothetical protein
VPFPTCWCVNRLPEGIGARLDAAYRSELAAGVPEAADDTRFCGDFAATCAWWMIATVSWNLLGALEKDGDWGISTLRQRQLLRLESAAALMAEFRRLDAIGDTARRMASRLRERWPEVEMPLYRPFREGALLQSTA